MVAQLPVDVATFLLLNEKRQAVAQLEARQGVSLILIPNRNLETPTLRDRARAYASDAPDDEEVTSYEPDHAAGSARGLQRRSAAWSRKAERPAVERISPAKPAPVREDPQLHTTRCRDRLHSPPVHQHLRAAPGDHAGRAESNRQQPKTDGATGERAQRPSP